MSVHPTSELRWSGRVLAHDDLRRNLNGHRRVVLTPQTILTPLALEYLHTHGVVVERDGEKPALTQACWGYAQEFAYPLVQSALRAVERDGLWLRELPKSGDALPCRWAKATAECVARGDCQGGVIFCGDPGLVCCVANKVSGLRAVAVTTIQAAARATLTLSANLIAVEMPGRTFFEIRQLLRMLGASSRCCPENPANTLRELDGHDHAGGTNADR